MLIDFNKLLPSGELSEKCKAALAELRGDELEVAMADLALDSLNELKFVPFPTRPGILVEFNEDCKQDSWKRMSKTNRDETTTKIYNYPEVQKYIEEMEKATTRNYANAKALDDYIAIWMQWEEYDNADKCWVIYREFPLSFTLGNRVLWRKKEQGFAKK